MAGTMTLNTFQNLEEYVVSMESGLDGRNNAAGYASADWGFQSQWSPA